MAARVKEPGLGALVKCACGCGASLREFDDRARPRAYLPGHQSRVLWRAVKSVLARPLKTRQP